jgi:FixJ family two-component response regulator
MIYVVEDDDAVRDSFRLILEARGFKVCDFSDSYSLFAYGVRKSASCFILDVNLPDESGLKILSRLRQNNIQLPVIMISGQSDNRMKAEAKRLNATAFFDKPVVMKEFIEALENINM